MVVDKLWGGGDGDSIIVGRDRCLVSKRENGCGIFYKIYFGIVRRRKLWY